MFLPLPTGISQSHSWGLGDFVKESKGSCRTLNPRRFQLVALLVPWAIGCSSPLGPQSCTGQWVFRNASVAPLPNPSLPPKKDLLTPKRRGRYTPTMFFTQLLGYSLEHCRNEISWKYNSELLSHFKVCLKIAS